MIKKKIIIVFGTRPEAIKMSPLVHALKLEPDMFEIKVCVTSQHRQMLDQVLSMFNIQPDFDLNLMKENQNLSNLTSLILSEIKKIFDNYLPDLVLVHGDTTTTLATSMAAFYASIPVGHVEAGLRTHDLKSPFPEEFNRQITSKISKWHFAPTNLSQKNLLSEGVNKSLITVTGNTVVDALYWILNKIEKNQERKKNIEIFLNNNLSFDWKRKNFILVTAHRRENFGKGFEQICLALKELASKYPKVNFIYPVHLNPNVQKPVFEILSENDNVKLIDPLSYPAFVWLMDKAKLIITDSGGVQEEAPSLGKPVLVMRDTTERPEAVAAGTVVLVGTDSEKIYDTAKTLLSNKYKYQKMSRTHNPYGDGISSDIIYDFIKSLY